MYLRDQTFRSATLLGLMTDAQGSVLPHADSIRPIAPPLPPADDGPVSVSSAGSSDAKSWRDRDAAREAAQVAQRQAHRRKIRRATRIEPYGDKVLLNAGGGSGAPLTMSPVSDTHYLSVRQVARRSVSGSQRSGAGAKPIPTFRSQSARVPV